MNTIFQHIQNLHNASGENGYNCAKHEHQHRTGIWTKNVYPYITDMYIYSRFIILQQ